MEENLSDSEQWHWLYSIPWWGYTCLAFAAILIVVGLEGFCGPIFGLSDWFFTALDTVFFLPISAGFLAAIPAVISLLCRWAGKGKQYKRKSIRLQRRILTYSFVFAMAGTALGMIPGIRVAVQNAAARLEAEEAAQSPWVEHIFSGENFAVSTPSNWVRVDVPSLGSAGYALVDEYSQLRVVVVATPKADSSITSVDELHQMAIAVVKRYGSNHAAGKMQSFLHRSFPARQTNVTWEDAPQKFQTATRQIEFPKHWVEIDLVASPSKFGKHEELLIRIADSIRRN